MRTVIAIVCLGLLAWGQAAVAAEPTVALTVSRHPSVKAFTDDEIRKALQDASEVMRKAQCPVTFTLNGSVRKFTKGAPAKIVSMRDLDKAHSEPTDVKIVKEIKCCVEKAGEYAGCSWPPKEGSHSIILIEKQLLLGNRWAHEFGHRMGLKHRDEPGEATAATMPLMVSEGVSERAVEVSTEECKCFQNPGQCHINLVPNVKPADKCPR